MWLRVWRAEKFISSGRSAGGGLKPDSPIKYGLLSHFLRQICRRRIETIQQSHRTRLEEAWEEKAKDALLGSGPLKKVTAKKTDAMSSRPKHAM